MRRYLHGQVIPWERMTRRQKAEHLVLGHSFDEDYFRGGETAGDGLGNAELIDWLESQWSDSELNIWHADDHAELDPEDSPIRFIHDHAKVPVDRSPAWLNQRLGGF